ncbi:MAG TPA: VWA domain-containing protein [Thermoanaerobaculia bacterium]|nr:VWA domain-containing protein [Thermoanaerobaculia bacterium]
MPAAVLLLFPIVVSARAQPRGAVDWIFLVDTSKSMRGVGGKNIFPDVKESIATFVREASDGDTAAVYTFDSEAHLHTSTEIRGKARDDLISIVDALEANGNRTHLGLAIQKGLDRAAAARAGGDKTRVQSVVLFTDGKEDVRGIAHPVPILANLDRVDGTYVFFVSMGQHEHETQLDEFARRAEHATVLRAPTREAIAEVAQRIRNSLPEPKPEPPPIAIPPAAPIPKSSPLRWLVLLPIVAAIAWLAWSRHRKNHQLEGELEILQPHVAPEAAFVGLPRLAATEIALSAVVPPEALAGSDARLFVQRRNGSKEVWIAASGGSLRVNDIETPTSALYDADTISIGDAKLRFNRVGHERTATPVEEEL